MRAAIVMAFVAAVLSGVAYVSSRMAIVERHLADTREALATLDYPQAAGSVDAAVAELGIARYLPVFGDRVQREARAYNAAILYWEREYDALVPEAILSLISRGAKAPLASRPSAGIFFAVLEPRLGRKFKHKKA